jgi:hypothetical protein
MDEGPLRGVDQVIRGGSTPGMIRRWREKMMLKSLSAVAALLMTTSFANAAFDAQSVAAQLTADGYTHIEIKLGQSIAKVEAIKGTTKIEVTYDLASGDVIKSETETVDDTDLPGVVGQDDNPGDDDGPDHDVTDDHGDDDDDQGGNSGPSGDDSDDDQGGDDGDDHSGGDDGHTDSGGSDDDGPNHDVDDDHGGDDDEDDD